MGEELDLNYPSQHLGAGADTLAQLANGTHPFCTALAQARLSRVPALFRPNRALFVCTAHAYRNATMRYAAREVKEQAVALPGANETRLKPPRVSGCCRPIAPW